MRDVIINYEDPILGRPGEVYQAGPYRGSDVTGMRDALDLLGCKVVSIKPYLKEATEQELHEALEEFHDAADTVLLNNKIMGIE